MSSYHYSRYESGDVVIRPSLYTKGEITVTVHCKIEEGGGRSEIDLHFESMSKDRAIGLLTPFSFEIRDYEDDEEAAHAG
ncbi:MAG: hypothetical protein ACR2RF_18695 [Geminicoccaceae bacterium]